MKVACIMPTMPSRKEQARRAMRCFEQQTYENRLLIISESSAKQTIGERRNELCEQACSEASIIAHWDDDDWSHPNRLTEQVSFLLQANADATGYNEMLFVREADGTAWNYSSKRPNYAVGTSLIYWARTWMKKPFPKLPAARGGTGEDTEWCHNLTIVARSSIIGDAEPRMIATIHSDNSMPYDPEFLIAHGAREWRRGAAWDSWAKQILNHDKGKPATAK